MTKTFFEFAKLSKVGFFENILVNLTLPEMGEDVTITHDFTFNTFHLKISLKQRREGRMRLKILPASITL